MSVPPEQEAIFYDNYFRLLKMMDSSYTIKRFANKVGKSQEKISNALRFCKLPEEIQDYVRERKLNYGMAIELQRARERLGLDEEETKYWTLSAMLEGSDIPKFRKKVNDALEAKNSNQVELWAQTDEQKRQTRKNHIRRTVAKEYINRIWENIGYFQKVQDLLESGDLGQENSPYSIRSPIRAYKAMIAYEKGLLPHIEDLLSKNSVNDAIEVLGSMDALIPQLEAKFTNDMDNLPPVFN
jgi:hypothetical protein